jgi:hypothetical protein
MNGMSITIINTGGATQIVNTVNTPYVRGTATLVSTNGIVSGTQWMFTSINGKWRGGVLS